MRMGAKKLFKDKKAKSQNKTKRPFIKNVKRNLGSDIYIENPQDEETRRWAVDTDDYHDKETMALENKKGFFQKDVKMEEVLPNNEKKDEIIPKKFGYFETKEGTVLVGYDKYNKRKAPMGFTLLSDDSTEENKIPENEPYDMNTYFGKNYQGNEKYFETNSSSFVYDPKNEIIQKLMDDDNNSENDDEELLYQTSKEELNEDELKDEKDDLPKNQRKVIDKKINLTKQIIKEKEDKNKSFLHEIEEFIKHFENDKLNTIIDSEDAVTRRKRITEMSVWIIEYERIKNILKKMDVKNLNEQEIYSLIKDKVNRISKADIKRIIDELKNQ